MGWMVFLMVRAESAVGATTEAAVKTVTAVLSRHNMEGQSSAYGERRSEYRSVSGRGTEWCYVLCHRGTASKGGNDLIGFGNQ